MTAEDESVVRRLVAEELRTGLPVALDFFRRQQDSGKSDVRLAFDQNYILYNATNARSSNPPPRGSILMADAGTTPNRVIALYLSTGGSLVEVFAKVI